MNLFHPVYGYRKKLLAYNYFEIERNVKTRRKENSRLLKQKGKDFVSS